MLCVCCCDQTQTSAQTKPLIWVQVHTEKTRTRLEFDVKATTHFKARSNAINVRILIPVPSDVSAPEFKKTAYAIDLVVVLL